MAKIDPDKYGVNTLAVRAGRQPTAEGEHSEPLFLTSSFVFKDAAQAAARFGDDEPGNIYSGLPIPRYASLKNVWLPWRVLKGVLQRLPEWAPS